jgi:hypothetical protein
VSYDLLNLPPPRKVIPTVRRQPKQAPTTLKHTRADTPAPAFTGYLLSEPIMAAIRERIEQLSHEEFLIQEDAKLKIQFADHFPLRLPDTTEDILNHIYHRIRLKDPHKITRSHGYTSAKRYHDAWKVLLEEHLAAGRIRPSSSEFASPAFCVPKIRKGLPDYTVPPRWVNNYRALNRGYAKNVRCKFTGTPRPSPRDIPHESS